MGFWLNPARRRNGAMGSASVQLGLQGLLWVLCFFASALALVWSCLEPPRHIWLSVGMILGVLLAGGVAWWGPPAIWPYDTHSFMVGSFDLNIKIRWVFTLPMLLGAVAVLALARHRTRARRAVPPEALPRAR
jgi:hypothetical protein